MITELSKRRVFRVISGYAVVCFVILQIADVAFEPLGIGDGVLRVIIAGMLLALPLVAYLSWIFDVDPESHLQRSNGGRPWLEASITALALVGLAFGVWYVLRPSGFEPDAQATKTVVDSDSEAPAQVDSPAQPSIDPAPSKATGRLSMTSQPPGARLRIRPLLGNDEWLDLGRTPVSEVSVPENIYEAQLELDGFAPAIRITGVPGARSVVGARALNKWNFSLPAPVELRPAAEAPQGMVFIPGGYLPEDPNSDRTIDIGAFYIDRFEVTNAQYQSFVTSGGYENPDYWRNFDFRSDDQQLSWQEAMAMFVDTTGRPGPAGWRFENFPSGEELLPVTGISWYEAIAYSRFRGKELPTAFHWRRAALGYSEKYSPAYGILTKNSNFGNQLVDVGVTNGFSQFGVRDVAGNAREWVRNELEGNRAILGASYGQQRYSFAVAESEAPISRDPQTGFRLIQRLEKVPEPDLETPLTPTRAWDPQIEPVSDEVYQVLAEQFSYTPRLAVATAVELTGTPRIKLERVDLKYPGSDEALSYFLLTPALKQPPFQPVLHFPNSDSFSSHQDTEPLNIWSGVDLIVESGRAVILPLFFGMNERYAGSREMTPKAQADFTGNAVITWRREIGQIVDHLERRGDMDTSRLVAWGLSFGATVGIPALASESRFKGMLLMFGGLTDFPLPQIAKAVNYLPHITVPVLIVNGRFDPYFPNGIGQQALYDHLGTDVEFKERFVYEGGHSAWQGPLKEAVLRRSVDWLDSIGPAGLKVKP